ncbi:MAG: helix-turn-helix transcriptional regulator [Turicibacter sp.]|nr:helix-turn-helix transcriptional regulator [Turicibacter sp.]
MDTRANKDMVADNLITLRTAEGYTQEQLVGMGIGLKDPRQYQRYEGGYAKLPGDVAYLITLRLNCTMDQIYAGCFGWLCVSYGLYSCYLYLVAQATTAL